jgi:hypothetical protein
VAASQKIVAIPRNPEALMPAELTDIELADQLGKKLNQVKLFKPIKERCDDLKEEVQSRCASKPAAQPTALTGREWRVDASAKAIETSIPPAAAIHRMFRAAKQDFYAAVTVTLKAIKEHLGEATLEKIATKKQTGHRTLTAVWLDNSSPAP